MFGLTKVVVAGVLTAASMALGALSWLAPGGSPGVTQAGLAHTQLASFTHASSHARTAAVRRGLLREFLTNNNQGYFYTAYPPEAASVVSRFGFRPTGATYGFIDTAREPGTLPLYRLQLVGQRSFLVTPSVSEKNSLIASGRFKLNGVLGFISEKPGRGETAVWRLGRGSQWRLATTGQKAALEKNGWHLDGLVGYAWTRQ